MTKKLWILVSAIFIFQLLVASGFELAHDEAYYWLYSRNLDWGFFDHPPFVGAVIKIFSFLPHSELAVRIGFIALQFATLTLLLSLTGAHFVTILLFFSFPLASITGLLALPDIPLLFMTAWYFFQLKRYIEKDSLGNSLTLGLIIALLFYAKYHGVLMVFFTVMAIPEVLRKKSFYIVAATAIIAFLPHMWWQYLHDFSTLRYHFLERPSSTFNLKRVIEYLGLQVGLAGLFVGPLVWWIVIKKKSQDQFTRTMKFVAIGSVVFFLISSFSKRVEANWTIYLAVPLIYLSAQSSLWIKRLPKILLWASFTFVLTTRVLFLLPPEITKIKRLQEFHGWESWAQKTNLHCEGQPLMANTYQVASKLSFYLEKEVQALNYHSRKNQFDYWRFDKLLPTKEVCYVTNKSGFEGATSETPEGKTLHVIKNKSLEELWELKYNESR